MFCVANPHSVQRTRQRTINSGCLSHMFSHWLYTGICQMNICVNNPFNQFITAHKVDFLIISTLNRISISFQFYYWRSREWKILEKSQITATYTHRIIYKFQLNLFITAQKMDFLIISSLFSLFLYLSSSTTREVANENFWKNHRVLLHIHPLYHKQISAQFIHNKWRN